MATKQDVRAFLSEIGKKGAMAQKKKFSSEDFRRWSAKGRKSAEAKRRFAAACVGIHGLVAHLRWQVHERKTDRVVACCIDEETARAVAKILNRKSRAKTGAQR